MGTILTAAPQLFLCWLPPGLSSSVGNVLPEAPTGAGPQLGWCLWSVCLSLEQSHYSLQNLEAGQLRLPWRPA